MISCNDFCLNVFGVKSSSIRVPMYPWAQQQQSYTNNQESSTDEDEMLHNIYIPILEDSSELHDEPNSTTKKEKCVSNNPVQFIRTPPIKATYSTDDSQEDNFSILMSPTATPIMETKSLFPTPSPADGDKLWHCHSPHPMVVIPMEQLMSPLLENEVLTIDQPPPSSLLDSDLIPHHINNEKEEQLLQLCSQRKLEEMDIACLGQLALDEEVDPNCRDLNGCPPLVLLCRYNQTCNLLLCVQTLLSRNSVSINAKDSLGFNALITVCYWHSGTGLLDVVKLLLERGIDTNAVTHHERWNAFFALIFNRRGHFSLLLPIMQALVEYGLNLNATIDGSNVLMDLAVSTKHFNQPDFVSVIQFLIEQGIDVNLKDDSGRNALCYITNLYHGPQLTDIVRILIDAGSEVISSVEDCDF